MGFSSYLCPACGTSIKNESCHGIDHVHVQCTMVFQDGTVKQGPYDGYGNIGPWHLSLEDPDMLKNPTIYHTACYYKAGSPPYQGQCMRAEDQGYFFDSNDLLNIPLPYRLYVFAIVTYRKQLIVRGPYPAQHLVPFDDAETFTCIDPQDAENFALHYNESHDKTISLGGESTEDRYLVLDHGTHTDILEQEPFPVDDYWALYYDRQNTPDRPYLIDVTACFI